MAAGKKDDKKAGAAPEGDALEAKQKKKKWCKPQIYQ